MCPRTSLASTSDAGAAAACLRPNNGAPASSARRCSSFVATMRSASATDHGVLGGRRSCFAVELACHSCCCTSATRGRMNAILRGLLLAATPAAGPKHTAWPPRRLGVNTVNVRPTTARSTYTAVLQRLVPATPAPVSPTDKTSRRSSTSTCVPSLCRPAFSQRVWRRDAATAAAYHPLAPRGSEPPD